MDFFKRYGSIGASQQQSASETIQRLADRVETSTLLEDKRAAVLSLKGLSREYRKDVGEASLPALLKVLKEDSEDQNLLKAVLETLTNLCMREVSSGVSQEFGVSTNDSSAQFSQTILDDSDDIISTLLELLGDADFYVRYYTVQLLGTLHTHLGEELQKRVLVSPTGVGRLVDLLSDQRDIIRNEGIQLLIAMTEDNADIQKIVAFENAFDHLLGIVDEEGGVRGNIIVQDCLQLLHNLLNYNVSNQNFFRETSGVQRLPNLLITDPSQTAAGRNGAPQLPESDDIEWTAQHARNMLVVLDIIRMLIQPGNTNTTSNQTAMQQCGIIPPLLQLALAYEAPSSVRSQALYAIGDIIRSHQINQGLFQRILITAAAEDDDAENADTQTIPEPAIVIVIRLSVGNKPSEVPANEYYIVRAASAYLVQAYVGSNPDAQLALAATLASPGDVDTVSEPEKHQSAGSLVVSVLLDWRESGREDVWRVWYASLLLSIILCDHVQCKEQALKLSIGDESKGEEPLPLLNELVSQARQTTLEGTDSRLCVAMFTLICVWLVGFPKGVATFLEESSNVSFLVEQISGSSGTNPLIQGVAAFLFGLIYQFDLEVETPMSRDALYPILSKRVGTDQLLVRVQRLRDSKEFQYAVGLAAGTHSNAYGGIPGETYFDNVFTDLFKKHYEGFRAAVRLGPKEVLANPNYMYMQGGMVGYAGSVGTNTAPGTPKLTAAGTAALREESPGAQEALLSTEAAAATSTDSEKGPTVPKGDYDMVTEQLAEQESNVRAMSEQVRAAEQLAADMEGKMNQFKEELSEEKKLHKKTQSQVEAKTKDIDSLHERLDELQKQQITESTAVAQSDDVLGDTTRVAELEKQLADLKLKSEEQEASWSSQRNEFQKKLSNAEKQVIKAAASGRSGNKKKEQQHTAAIQSLKEEISSKDEQISKLNQIISELEEKFKDIAIVDELRSKIAQAENDQEDLMAYMTEQENLTKEYK
ncbi:Vesicle-mediated ER to Golgi transport protein, partial [Coemansia sp. RSA 1365]